MEEETPSFCTGCGAPLREADTFCTACGSKNAGYASVPAAQQGTQKRSARLWAIFALAVIWAAYAICYSIWCFLTPNPTFSGFQQIADTLFTIMAVITLISGIAALMTAILILMRRMHLVALILCVAGSVFAFAGGFSVIPMFIGLVVAYFLFKSDYEFMPAGRDAARSVNEAK